jgi:hypothetical protein
MGVIMPWNSVRSVAACWLLLVGCGASPTPAPKVAEVPRKSDSPPHEPVKQKSGTALTATASTNAARSHTDESAFDANAAPSVAQIPTACASGDGHCLPPEGFARQLCRGKFPSLALVLFEKHAPWEHVYLRVEELEPVNAHGGPRSDAMLRFGEELILLKRAGNSNHAGIAVSGASDVDVLRLDGTCATIREEALARYVPGTIITAPVVWKFLDDDAQEVLLKDRRVQTAEQNERRSCHKTSVSQRDERCAEANRGLDSAILLALKRGIALPSPKSAPRWSN